MKYWHPRASLSFVAVVLLFLCLPTIALSAIIYVKTDGSDLYDGVSWDTAKLTIQAGINTASANDEVWVKTGTYVEKITLKEGVKVYGGYSGVGSTRDIKTCVTTIDGNAGGSVVTSPSGVTTATIIDGFTIRNGSATYGGGIFCSTSSPTIAHNTITENAAHCGGGIQCTSASPSILNNTVSANTADDGGGICCFFSSSSPRISGNTLTANTGGAIQCSISSPTITDNVIISNSARNDGGGGGIDCERSSATITGNRIIGNSAQWYGGAINCSQSAPTILNNVIAGNYCEQYGGGIACSNSSSPTISSNTIVANSAPYAGGIYCTSSSPIISNNTITGNCAYQHGGISCESSSPAISNNIVAFNSSGVGRNGGSPALRNNDVYGNAGQDYSGISAGIGDMSADPLLASREYGNPHIQPTSPCRNSGWASAPGLAALDMDGQTRTGDGAIDIGADESYGETWAVTTTVVRVSPTGNNANDGSAWDDGHAKRTVQAGIDVASAAGGEVWTKTGCYSERITLRPYVYLYGGFAGIESARSERNWVMNSTVLDGAAAGSVVTADAVGHLLSAIDGFTIRNGAAAQGGGVHCRAASLRIANCTIVQNSTVTEGGGIYCEHSSSIISSNLIADNVSDCGGGILCWASSAVISNNSITGNDAQLGGGMVCTWGSPTIANNVVAFNSSGIFSANGTPALRSNDVYGNTAYDYSGASPGVGDIAVDPLFVNRTGGDYHLRITSPCIGSGDNRYVAAGALDIDGDPRVFPAGGTVDIGADEYSTHPLWSPSEAKRLVADDQEAYLAWRGGVAVTAKLTDIPAFYVESTDRASGLQCQGASLLDEGQYGIVHGTMATIDGERVLTGTTVVPESLSAADVPAPLVLRNGDLGGGDSGLQQGVRDFPEQGYWPKYARGLNNIGLLVTVWGNVTHSETDAFWVDDGSALDDGSGHLGVKVYAPGMTLPTSGHVFVTGVSSCEKKSDDLVRLLRVRKQADIVPY